MKKIVVILALVGILIWNMPNTISLLANTHSFYNISAPCYKCHGDVLNQIDDVGNVNIMHRSLDDSLGCKSCHINSQISMGANQSQDFHAATSSLCLNCHSNNTSGNASNIYGNLEAHKKIIQSNNSDWLHGNNNVCIVCHTKIPSVILMANTDVFAFEFDSINASNRSSTYNGSYSVTIQMNNGGLHNFNDDVSCILCHQKVQDVFNQNEVPYTNHSKFGCVGCHRGTGNITNQTIEISTLYHSAKIKYCSDCHIINSGDKIHRNNSGGKTSRDCNQCHKSHGGLKAI